MARFRAVWQDRRDRLERLRKRGPGPGGVPEHPANGPKGTLQITVLYEADPDPSIWRRVPVQDNHPETVIRRCGASRGMRGQIGLVSPQHGNKAREVLPAVTKGRMPPGEHRLRKVGSPAATVRAGRERQRHGAHGQPADAKNGPDNGFSASTHDCAPRTVTLRTVGMRFPPGKAANQ